MKKIGITLILLVIGCASFAQILHGRIINEKDGKPVTGASIYVNNTSSGTSSDNNGEFTLSHENWNNADLIVSCIGFETVAFRPDIKELSNKKYVVKITPRNTEMEPVLILTDAQRRKFLQIFKDNFLGITEEGDASKITNLQSIYFIANKSLGVSFIAKADEPLQIINKRLGYKIIFDLTSFSYNDVERSTSFFGYTRYESLGDNRRYLKHRAEAYYGSLAHFCASLAKHELEQQGFSLLQIVQQQNMNIGYAVKDSTVLKINEIDTSIYNLSFPYRLQVSYGFEQAGRKYLVGKSLLVPSKSWLQLRDSAIVYLDKEGGILNPEDLLVDGYWSFEKAASLLPLDYEPDTRFQPRRGKTFIAPPGMTIQKSGTSF